MELSLGEGLGWAALLILICAWFFILGIFVGRGLVPVPGQNEVFKKQLAQAEKNLRAGAETSEEEKPAAPKADKQPSSAEKEPTQPEATLPPAADQPEEKVPLVEKHIQKNEEEHTDDMGDKIFTIQVAALREKDAADKLFEKLKNGNYDPYVVEAALPDNVTWYRMRCGRFADHTEAAPVLKKLRDEGYSPILVRR